MNSDDLRNFATRYTVAWCNQDPAHVAAFFSDGGSLQVNDGNRQSGETPSLKS